MATRTPPPSFRQLGLRVVTAVAIGAVIVGVAVFGRLIGLAAVVALIAALALLEFYELTRTEHRKPNEVFGLVAAGAMPLAAATHGRAGLIAVVTGLIVVSLAWHVLFRKVSTADTATTVFGAVYIGFTLAHLVLMRALDGGTELVLATIVSVWANDVFAYLVGTWAGRHKLAPRISPNKSWEGLAAGGAVTLAVWALTYRLVPSDVSLPWHLLVGAGVVFAAIVGDLAESRFKREAGVKDSGTLLPGHGGFLDRFDSLLTVSVVAYYLLVWGGAR